MSDAMENENDKGLNQQNVGKLLKAFIEEKSLTCRKIAACIDCSQKTIERITEGQTLPSGEMIKQCGILFELGYKRYKNLSRAEKEKISENITALGGGVFGFGAISSAISAFGTAGLSAAGISSGLGTIGGFAGGGMVAGVGVLATAPVLAASGAHLIAKGVKGAINNSKLNKKDIDPVWGVRIFFL